MTDHEPDLKKARFVPLENNPEVMTTLVHKLGLSKDLSWHDVFSLDDPSLLAFVPRPAHALLLVFPVSRAYETFREDEDKALPEYSGSGSDEEVLWFKQTIGNACGLMGLLHAVCNGMTRDLIIPSTPLANLITDALPRSPAERVKLLETSEDLAAAHASAAATGNTEAPSADASIDLHFVAFVKSPENNLWELDGRRKGPLNRGKLPEGEDILGETAIELGPRKFLKREAESADGEMRFSILALGPGFECVRSEWVLSYNDLTPFVHLAGNLNVHSKKINSYTESQRKAQQVVAAITALSSFLLTIVTLFSIVKIDRLFRHKLILLLIVSQLSKSFWYLIYSTFKLAQGQDGFVHDQDPGHATSPFCQVDGVLNAYSTEAADFAVLLISLHTVLSVFKRRTHSNHGGLYPYRILSYAGWVAFPTITSSLAYVNGRQAYLEQGTSCTLPIRPFWYRLALNWIPRYLILIFILGVSTTLYVYVGVKFRAVNSRLSESAASFDSQVYPERTPNADRSNSSTSALQKRHHLIKRQLRYMFVYPLVYLVFWVLPFASHCYGYTNVIVPFSVSTASIASYNLQGAADCIIFLIREKPWRQMQPIKIPLLSVRIFGPKVDRRSIPDGTPEVQSMPARPTRYQRRKSRHWWDAEGSIMGRGGTRAEESPAPRAHEQDHAG